jgi:hypothetical protein
LESLDASCGIDQLLLTGEEGMALIADLDAELVLSGMHFEGVAACTDRGHYVQLGMDIGFHYYLAFQEFLTVIQYFVATPDLTLI